MLFAHAPLSVLANERLQKKQLEKIDHRFIPFILIVAMLAGILPDFDFFILAAQSKPAFLHHNLITHTPFFWIIFTLILRQGLFFLRKYLPKARRHLMSNGFINILTLSFLIGTMSHILADLFLGYIMLLYPLTKTAFTIFGDLFPINPTISYITHPLIIVEIMIVLGFVHSMLKKYFEVSRKVVKLAATISFIILSIIFGLFSYYYANTYIPKVENDRYNRINYDSDDDWQIDSHDLDINNNGKDNIEDIQRDKVVEIAEKIGKSNKLAATNSDNLLQRFGVLSPYSIISMVYFENHRTLEPVIRQYLINENEEAEYSLNSYLELLKSRNSLEDFNSDTQRDLSGYTLFILDSKKNVVNAGIFVSGQFNTANDEILIISPFDKRTSIHSLSEIEGIYSRSEFKYLVER